MEKMKKNKLLKNLSIFIINLSLIVLMNPLIYSDLIINKEAFHITDLIMNNKFILMLIDRKRNKYLIY